MTNLTATSYEAAIETVQEIHPESFVEAWDANDGWDVAVYASEDDFDADAESSSNDRMIARYPVIRNA